MFFHGGVKRKDGFAYPELGSYRGTRQNHKKLNLYDSENFIGFMKNLDRCANFSAYLFGHAIR